MSRRAPGAFVAACLLLGGCEPAARDGEGPTGSASAATTAAAEVVLDDAALALREAEQRRAAGEIPLDALRSRDVEHRRAAARALARIGGKAARAGLAKALLDGDADVVAWAAHGIGAGCAESREEDVAALAARALSLETDAAWEIAGEPIARAIGRCAATTSEPTLAAWLSVGGVRARAAALALGDLAAQTKKLREETLVALMALAEGGVATPPVPEALFAPARLDHVPPSVTERLGEVASRRLAEAGPYRLLAVRALSRAREHGLAALERVLLEAGDATFTLPERVEAVRSAARTGRAGRSVAQKVLARLVAKGEALTTHAGDAQLTLATLAALGSDAPKAELEALAALPVGDERDARRRRIAVQLRCRAARELAGEDPRAPRLLGCDPAGGLEARLAELTVLGRGSLRGPRAARYRQLAADADARVREQALELLSAHPEVDRPGALLLDALRSKSVGVAAVAAEQIAKNPSLASGPKPKKAPRGDDDASDAPAPPDPALVEALLALLDRASTGPELELVHAALDALGALGQKELASKLEPWCASTWPTAREHAAKALSLLEGKKRVCEPPEADAKSLLDVVRKTPPRGTRLVFETDAGELTVELDVDRAPVTAARLERLASSGYYDGQIVHRVDPSFVAQLGAPEGDGFGGAPGDPPLRCETSPAPFEELSVGLALAGRDTGSAQIFVMRARHPHLDGQYPLVGKARGDWASLVEGDRIARVRVER